MTSRSGRSRNRKGFTLLELMIVLLIIAGILGIALPALLRTQQKAHIRNTGNQISLFERALKEYNAETGTYPTTAQGLDALIVKPQGPTAAPVASASTMTGAGMGGAGMPMAGPGMGTDPMNPMGTMGTMGTDPMNPMGTMGADPMNPMGTMGADPMNPMGTMGTDPMNPMGTASMPATTSAPVASGSVQNWGGPYLEVDTIPLDPWGEAYVYEYPSQLRTADFPAVYSKGPDKTAGTDDDIFKWDPATEGRATSAGTSTTVDPMNPMGTMGTDPMNPMGTDPMNPMGTMGNDPMNPMGMMGNDPMNPMGGMGTDPMGGMGTDPMGGMGTDPMNPMGTDPMNPMGTDPFGGNIPPLP